MSAVLRKTLPLWLGLLFFPMMVSAATLSDAKGCYLSFFEVYKARYLEQSERGRCVQLEYLRDVSASALAEATLESFGDRHGANVLADKLHSLRKLTTAYQDVSAGESYQYCLIDEYGLLRRNKQTLVTIENKDTAVQIMEIWVGTSVDGKPRWNFPVC